MNIKTTGRHLDENSRLMGCDVSINRDAVTALLYTMIDLPLTAILPDGE